MLVDSALADTVSKLQSHLHSTKSGGSASVVVVVEAKHFHVDREIREPFGNLVPYVVVEPWTVQAHVPMIFQCRLNVHECL